MPSILVDDFVVQDKRNGLFCVFIMEDKQTGSAGLDNELNRLIIVFFLTANVKDEEEEDRNQVREKKNTFRKIKYGTIYISGEKKNDDVQDAIFFSLCVLFFLLCFMCFFN